MSARDSIPQRRLEAGAEPALQFVLRRLGGPQDLARAQEVEHPELVDAWPHENVRRPHLQLFRGDRALHDLRRAEHRLERGRTARLAPATAEGDVDGDDDV